MKILKGKQAQRVMDEIISLSHEYRDKYPTHPEGDYGIFQKDGFFTAFDNKTII